MVTSMVTFMAAMTPETGYGREKNLPLYFPTLGIWLIGMKF
jgi:hypothetical protein